MESLFKPYPETNKTFFSNIQFFLALVSIALYTELAKLKVEAPLALWHAAIRHKSDFASPWHTSAGAS